MKRIICVTLSIFICLILVACGASADHAGEAKTPSGSSVMEGQNYQDVIKKFEEKGFTNIKTEKIEDLVFGWLTDDGEVEKVSVGGNEDYSPDKWIPADTEVIIYYHTFPDDIEIAADSNISTTVNDGDNKAENSDKRKIVMTYSSADYCNNWTLEEVTKHLSKLGFTNITVTECEPHHDNYSSEIKEIYIETGFFGKDPWTAGEEFNSDAEISIYYSESSLLSIENCPDLETILSSKEINYLSFANLYDDKYVEFDAYVTNHITYDGGTSHIIEVTGGDYDGIREIHPYDESCFEGIVIRIGDRTTDNSIAMGVEAGDNVRVHGRIDASWSEYYKMLYVETITLERR